MEREGERDRTTDSFDASGLPRNRERERPFLNAHPPSFFFVSLFHSFFLSFFLVPLFARFTNASLLLFSSFLLPKEQATWSLVGRPVDRSVGNALSRALFSLCWAVRPSVHRSVHHSRKEIFSLSLLPHSLTSGMDPCQGSRSRLISFFLDGLTSKTG